MSDKEGNMGLEDGISVIVPVYNCEQYIDKCLHSLINQSYHYLQIILINDGSSDNSGKICDQYEELDERVTTVHKEHRGVSAARNSGIQMVKKKYLMFVDADDCLPYHACQQLYDCINENDADIVIGRRSYSGIKGKKMLIPFENNISYNGYEFVKNSLVNNSLYFVVHTSIYHTKYIISNHFFFLEGYVHEDEEWCSRVFLKADRIATCKKIVYVHRNNLKSITRDSNNFSRNAKDYLKLCEIMYNLYNDIGDSELKRLLIQRMMRLYYDRICTGGLVESDYHINIKFLFKTFKYLQGKDIMKLLNIFVRHCVYLGIGKGCHE